MDIVFDGGDGGIIIGGGNAGGNVVNPGIAGNNIIKLPELGEGFNLDEISLSRETPGYRGPDHGEPYVNEAGLVNKGSAKLMLDQLVVTEDDNNLKDVGYSRSEWVHWAGTEGRSCWSTREEILHRDSVTDSVKYIDKSKKQTETYEEACAIGTPYEENGKIKINNEKSGEWIGPYKGIKISDASSIDIDHVIPLSNAARSGGQDWDKELKKEFANDPMNLLATSAKENRTKGDKGPGEYMPPLKAYRCQYAKTYTTIAYKYGLTITKTDYETLDDAIKSCQY